MSFRNRPVLDRKHRPRWQDELRSQQLIVAGFALAIAVAIGIFGAAAWISYYNGNLRQVALVDGSGLTRAEVLRRLDIVSAELSASYIDLQSQLGGARDTLINQQLQGIQTAAGQLNSTASDSLLTTMLLDRTAAELGIELPAAAVDAEVASRRTQPERRQVSIILAEAKIAEGAEAGSDPTDADFEAARQRAEETLAEIRGGADFATLAAERSDDSSKATNGLLGWLEEDDALYSIYYAEAGKYPIGQVAGPVRGGRGWYLIRLDARRDAGSNVLLDAALAASDVSDDEFREYIRGEVLRRRFRSYFASSIVTRYQPQREVAQIFLNAEQGTPVPKMRIRHLLVQPLPGEEDQSTATDEEWGAALSKAVALHAEASKPDADWLALAKQSDDPGSRDKGGILGWYSSTDITAQLDPDFATATLALEVGETSEPVRSSFGYHIIQITENRDSALALAQRLVDEAREDPDSFADLALRYSEEATSAAKGGELGWIIRYELDAERDAAIFALTEPDQISDVVETATGLYVYRLLDTADQRYVAVADRRRVSNSGFAQWLTELKDQAEIWIDPEYAPTPTTG